jgi:hypothetical protein
VIQIISSEYCSVTFEESDDLISSLKKIHEKVPLIGRVANELLTLPDDMVWYIIAGIRNTPVSPAKYSLEEWMTCISLLRSHLILPLIAYHIYSWPLEFQPPPEIVAKLVQEFNSAMAQSMMVEHQLETLVNSCNLNDLPVILLKGSSLSRTIYKDPALRLSADIDLLVLPENMKNLESVLENLGYSSPAKTFDISCDFYQEQIFFPPKKGVRVEGHWVLDCNYDIFQKDWIRQVFRERITIHEQNFRFDMMKKTHHLLYLVFHHIFHHDTLTLAWIMDFAYLIQDFSDEEWEEIRSDCVKHNLRIPMELAIIIGSLWSGFVIPVKYTDFRQWPVPSEKELKRDVSSTTMDMHLRYFFHMMFALSSNKEKIRYIFKFIFPPPGLLMEFRKSDSFFDLLSANARRWMSITRHLK